MSTRARDAFQAVRREEILDAATEVIVKLGADATMQQIAAASGLTPGALYRYFPDKDALVHEAFAHCFEASKRIIEETLNQTGSPLGALVSLVRGSGEVFQSEGARDGMILNLEAVLQTVQLRSDGEDPPALIDIGLIETAKRLTRQAQESGEIPPDVDSDGLAVLLIGSLQGLQLLIALFGSKVDTAPATTLLADMVEGLGPASSRN